MLDLKRTAGRITRHSQVHMLSILLAACLASSARADRRIFVWNYEAQTVPRGEAELESYLTFSSSDRKHTAGNTVAEHQLELEIGMTDRYDFAIYQVFAQEPGRSLAYDGYKLRARYALAKPGSRPFASAAYLEFEGSPDLMTKAVEAKWILTRDFGGMRLTLNPGLEVEREPGEWETEPEYAAGAAWRVAHVLSVGLEAKGNKDGSYLGPVVGHGIGDLWTAFGSAVRLGGKEEGEPDLQVRLLLGFRAH